MENSTQNFTNVKGKGHKHCSKFEPPDLEESLMWKLHLRRKEVFQEMNSDLNEVVEQCLKAKRRLEALEDSNRNLKREVRSLRTKYESILEKNKKDTGIIMRLKDSELILKEAAKAQEETNESLLNVQLKNHEKTLERKLLQDDRQKLLFKSQTVTNLLRKINLKHKQIHEMIEIENKIGKENESRLTLEIQELKSNLHEDDSILKEWLKDNTVRDSAIRLLQDEIKTGSMVLTETIEDFASEETSEVDTVSIETEADQSIEKEIPENDAKMTEIEKTDPREIAFRQEWLRKKVLCEAAERKKEHWMDFYMLLNQRVHDLHIEVMNVRQWRIDKEAEKKELTERAEKLEELVSQKRRKRSVPQRSSLTEMNIWIKVQRETNKILRKVVARCSSIKIEDSVIYSEFVKIIRDRYLDTLKEQLSLEPEKGEPGTEENLTETEKKD